MARAILVKWTPYSANFLELMRTPGLATMATSNFRPRRPIARLPPSFIIHRFNVMNGRLKSLGVVEPCQRFLLCAWGQARHIGSGHLSQSRQPRLQRAKLRQMRARWDASVQSRIINAEFEDFRSDSAPETAMQRLRAYAGVPFLGLPLIGVRIGRTREQGHDQDLEVQHHRPVVDVV